MSYPVRKLRKRKVLRRSHVRLIYRSEGAGHHMKGILGRRLARDHVITPRQDRDPAYARNKADRLKERHSRRALYAKSPRAKRHYRGWQRKAEVV